MGVLFWGRRVSNHALPLSDSWLLLLVGSVHTIIWTSLSEPHIDHDNSPRTRNNGICLSIIYPAFVAPWCCWLCSHCHNIISSGSPPVFFECTSWGEPEQAPHLSNGVPHDLCIYLSMYHTSFRKQMPPCSNSLDSFNFTMCHQFHKCHHVQIASILHVQWLYSTTTSVCMLLPTTQLVTAWS